MQVRGARSSWRIAPSDEWTRATIGAAGKAVLKVHPWLGRLRPVGEHPGVGNAVLNQRAHHLSTRIGEGPAGWAVQLGASMAERIFEDVPELGVNIVAAEVRKGCEAVALTVVDALAGGEPVTPLAGMPEILTGPTEVVTRGIGIERMLRSIHVAHATAAQTILDSAQQFIPESQRFVEMQRISALLFAIVDELSERMAREYGRAREVWSTSTAALRMEVIETILRGDDVPMQRATRVLGYDPSRYQLAVIAFSDASAPVEQSLLHAWVDSVLTQAQCVTTLVLPVGAHQVWAWGSRPTRPPELPSLADLRPDAGLKLAVGLPATGVDGFRRSHQQALHAARLGGLSATDRWLFDYAELDVVAMLTADLDAAREFVLRELGALAGPGAGAAVARHTLKSYLDRGRSLVATAEYLHVARNTVAYRVQRAEQLRGRAIDDRRMQVHAALTLAEELGDGVCGESA